jgi:dTDP-D-glucose 4,6-dehydratase
MSPLGAYHALMYGRSMYFAIDRARTELDWTPRWSNDEMLAQSYDWYLEHRDAVLRTTGASHHRSPVRQGVLRLVSRLL